MEDSSNSFVQSLRERIANATLRDADDVKGYAVEEHDYDELDDSTQAAVDRLFDTMQLRKESLSDEDAFATVRTRRLSIGKVG
jgi:hypothetical protein